MSNLEMLCSAIMLVSAAGCLLMLYAAVAIETQRKALADLHAHCQRLTFQRQAAVWQYRALRAHVLALAMSGQQLEVIR